jgi:hypothetical protein
MSAFGPDAASQLALDPFARLARVASDDEAQLPVAFSHGAHESRTEPGNRLVIERMLARLAANAVSSKKPM